MVNNYQPRAPHPGDPPWNHRRGGVHATSCHRLDDPGEGIRIEELTELSHHSLIQYRLPATGELIPLLQITPSKTDQERLLVISPELADVLSTIIGRIRGDDQPDVPLVVSYDQNERVYNPPMPLLFQHRRRLETRAVSETALRSYLDHALTATGIIDRSGNPLRYTFHDFRRLFITDAIMHGMPPHIARLVAGHRDIDTTMGYQGRLPRGGHQRAPGIHRPAARATPQRGSAPQRRRSAEFLGHFERRKVAIGDCGRSYATPASTNTAAYDAPAPARPRRTRPPHPDPRQPPGPHHRIRDQPVVRRSRRPEGQPRRRPRQTRPNGPDHHRRDTAPDLGIPTFTDAAGRATNRPQPDQNP